MIWRTWVSLPRLPVKRTAAFAAPVRGAARPTSVARTALSAASGWSRLTFKSASSVSRAGWSSSAITTLSRASVTTRTLDTGLQPWVTREIKSTCGPKATPLMPPLKTPLLRPWPGSVPSPDSANCTLRPRLLDKPPNR